LRGKAAQNTKAVVGRVLADSAKRTFLKIKMKRFEFFAELPFNPAMVRIL